MHIDRRSSCFEEWTDQSRFSSWDASVWCHLGMLGCYGGSHQSGCWVRVFLKLRSAVEAVHMRPSAQMHKYHSFRVRWIWKLWYFGIWAGRGICIAATAVSRFRNVTNQHPELPKHPQGAPTKWGALSRDYCCQKPTNSNCIAKYQISAVANRYWSFYTPPYASDAFPVDL